MRRNIIIGGLVGIATIFLASWLWWWLCVTAEHRINRHGFSEIRNGMAEDEVEDVLGIPAGDYTRNLVITFYYPTHDTFISGQDLLKRQQGKEWVGNHACIFVGFDKTNHVTTAMLGEVRFLFEDSYYDRVDRWFKP